MHPALRVGLTGGIGSGKSTVAGMFSALSAALIDADALSRQATAAGGAAMPEIASVFGGRFVDASGAMDRAQMRALVFADPTAKQRLEAIVHPIVSAETARLLDTTSAPCVILDIPLLVESGHWRQRLDTIVVVDCLEATQMARTKARSALSEQTISQIMASQATRAERLASADAVLYNEAISLEELHHQVGQLARRFGL